METFEILQVKGQYNLQNTTAISVYKEDKILISLKANNRYHWKKLTVSRQSYYAMEILKQQLVTGSLDALVFREQKPRSLLEK